MVKVWITYAWKDNVNGDVDFVAQELKDEGLDIRLDRWNLKAGERLWEQISEYIQNHNKSDCWLFFATQNSLNSEPCKEELAYALDRALEERGQQFPIIALTKPNVDHEMLPTSIKTRLYISLTDPDWKQRIKAAAERQEPNIRTQKISPFYCKVHNISDKNDSHNYAIEMRPRAGIWGPFIVAFPFDEKDAMKPDLWRGTANKIPPKSGFKYIATGKSQDGQFALIKDERQATPTLSFYLFCKQLPSKICFGENGNEKQYYVELN